MNEEDWVCLNEYKSYHDAKNDLKKTKAINHEIKQNSIS